MGHLSSIFGWFWMDEHLFPPSLCENYGGVSLQMAWFLDVCERFSFSKRCCIYISKCTSPFLPFSIVFRHPNPPQALSQRPCEPCRSASRWGNASTQQLATCRCTRPKSAAWTRKKLAISGRVSEVSTTCKVYVRRKGLCPENMALYGPSTLGSWNSNFEVIVSMPNWWWVSQHFLILWLWWYGL